LENLDDLPWVVGLATLCETYEWDYSEYNNLMEASHGYPSNPLTFGFTFLQGSSCSVPSESSSIGMYIPGTNLMKGFTTGARLS
jgi:hypothetical protein